MTCCLCRHSVRNHDMQCTCTTCFMQSQLVSHAGTFPLQSERMFAALQGHGCKTRLVVLPHESHGYRAHESVMHVLAEKESWFEAHCAGKQGNAEGAHENSNGAQDAKSDAAAAPAKVAA